MSWKKRIAPGPTDREIADLIDHEERREDQRLQPLAESSGLARLLEGGDQVGEGPVVDPAPALGRRDGEADRQGAHGGDQPTRIAERDLGAEQGLQRVRRTELPAVDAGEDRVQGLE